MAAGQSKRVKPIEDKNFIRFCGKYLIEWQLENLKEAGINDLLIIANGLNLARLINFIEIAKDFRNFPTNIKFKEQKQLDLGMAGAIVEAHEVFDSNEVLILSSNDIVDLDAYELILKESLNYEGAIIGYKVSEYFPGGYLKVDKDGFLNDIIEKPIEGAEPSDMINLVIHYFKDVSLLVENLKKEIADKSKDDVYERAISRMLKSNLKIKVLPYHGFWQAIKYPWHILSADRYFFEKRHKMLLTHKSEGENWISQNAQVAETAVIKGKVIVETGAKIFDHVVINGPAYIGKNSIVANNALVRDSYLGENCVVGFITEIARSHLGDDVWTHSNYIGDSVIGDNVSFGAGTVTGNLRLDEGNIKFGEIDSGKNKLGLVTGNNVRCGINVSFMPGLKVGSNTMIGGGIMVAEDIEDDTFVKGETNLKIYKNKLKVENKRSEAMKKLR